MHSRRGNSPATSSLENEKLCLAQALGSGSTLWARRLCRREVQGFPAFALSHFAPSSLRCDVTLLQRTGTPGAASHAPTVAAPGAPGDVTLLQGVSSPLQPGTAAPDAPGQTMPPLQVEDGAPPASRYHVFFGVCLEDVSAAGRGAALPATYPACARRGLHLGCLAQFHSQANANSDLRCPVCLAGGWTSDYDEWLAVLCSAGCVEAPQRLPDCPAVRRNVADYKKRAFTDQDVPGMLWLSLVIGLLPALGGRHTFH